MWYKTPDKDWLSLLSHFKQALLGLNAGFEPWADWYQDRIEGKPINRGQEEKWLNIPSEIREQGAKATNAYRASLIDDQQKSTLQPLNLVRAIFIGNGAAGKTSLIRKLHREDVVEGKEEMTPGIDIREWSIPETDIKAKFWDFGGQVMSHSTHQFFLRERCLYVLVVDAGSEREIRENQTANEQAEYWLEHIKAFSNKAPVMLVGNKSDKVKVNLDMHALVEKYKNIIGFYPLSCTSEEAEFKLDYEKFETVLIKQLKEVGTHQVLFTPNQFAVLGQVRKESRKEAFLAHEKFDALCKEHEIGKQGLDQDAFLGLLDALGEIIHFPELEWSDAYVLNPRWLTYGVYTLLYSDEVKVQQGLLSRSDVVSILQSEKVVDEQGNTLAYPKAKCGFIVDAMTQFKLCYQLADSGHYVIPDKLPKDQPDLSDYFDKNKAGTLAFEFSFASLLPRNVMPNLIVARHTEIVKDEQGKQLVWQRGVILHNPEYKTTARWKVDYHQRTLQLWVQGEGAREYQYILRDSVQQIFKGIKGLRVIENVILPRFARINTDRFMDTDELEKTTYKSLLEEARLGRKVTISDSGAQYDLEQVMGFIMTKEQQNKETAKIENHFHGDTNMGVQNTGDHNKVKVKIILKSSDKKEIAELQESVKALMSHVEKHDADFAIKASAYEELQEINKHLANLETATPETKNKLIELLSSIKDGTLGAIKLGKEIKEAEEVTTWLMEKATVVSALLTTLV
ncbi:MAG: COR domain-containing protein [Thiotrichaceae bacterium]